MKNLIVVILSLCLSLAAYGGMVAHYEFEGNLTDSAGDYDGSAVGTIGYSPCGLAGGSQCLGLTSYGAVNGTYGVVLDGTENLFDSPETITIAFWYKAVPAAGDARWDAFVSKLGPGLTAWDGQGWSVRMYSDSQDVAFTTRLPSGAYPYSNGYNVRDGEWYHIVATYASAAQKVPYDGNSAAKIYINGTLAATKLVAGGLAMTTSSTVPITIGVSIEDTGYDFIYKDGQYGYIDDVRLYNNVLTASEVADLYNSTFTVPVVTANPQQQIVNAGSNAVFTVGGSGVIDSYTWYKSSDPCNATPGDDVAVGTDSNTLTITNVQLSNEGYYYCVLQGTVSNSTSNVALLMTKRLVSEWIFENNLNDSVGTNNGTPKQDTPVYDSGKVGTKAILINNDVNDSVIVPFSPKLNTNSFTVSAWAKAAIGSSNTTRGLINARTTTPDSGTFTYLSSLNKWTSKVRNSSGSEYSVLSTNAMPEDQWQFVAFTFEATGMSGEDVLGTGKIYIDGILDAQTSDMSYKPNTTANLVFGSVWTPTGGYYNPFNGLIDDVRYYNYALDARNVGQLYADVTGQPLCIVGSEFDFNGDCLVNFKDFAEFATEWLDNSFVYPNN
jgi:hypothetical protein